MAKKTYLAQDVLNFVKSDWPPEGCWYYEDVLFLSDDNKNLKYWQGHLMLADGVDKNLKVPVDDLDGVILWQGQAGEDPTQGDGKSFIRELNNFLKYQTTTTTCIVEVPNEKVDAFKKNIAQLGLKVSK